jgi:hypothetical protein
MRNDKTILVAIELLEIGEIGGPVIFDVGITREAEVTSPHLMGRRRRSRKGLATGFWGSITIWLLGTSEAKAPASSPWIAEET